METEELATKSVGNLLREARLAKGLSIEEIESATNIRGLFLTYLENEEYDKTPGEFFVKGAIRTYGNFLGLDGAKLVELYKQSSGGKTLHATEAQGIREAKNVTMKLQLKDKRDIGSGTGKIELPKLSQMNIPWLQVGMGAAALVLIGALYFAVPAVINWSKTSKEQPSAPAPIVAPQKETQPKAAPVIDKLVLELKASGACWLEVTADGNKVAELMLREGDSKTYEAKEKLTVKYGNVGAVNIILNGKNLNAVGEHGVANMVYTKETLERQQEKTATQGKSPEQAAEKTVPQAPVAPTAVIPAATQNTEVTASKSEVAEKQVPEVSETTKPQPVQKDEAPATVEAPKAAKPEKKSKKSK